MGLARDACTVRATCARRASCVVSTALHRAVVGGDGGACNARRLDAGARDGSGRGPPVRILDLASAAVLFVDQAGVLALRRISARGGRACEASARREATARVLDASVRRCVRADQFPGDQSRRARARPENRRREPARGLPQFCCGRRQGAHHDERRVRVRDRTRPRRDAGKRRLPEPADRADPVRRDDDARREAPAGHRAAVHQQVLHPRPAARQLVRPPRGCRGPHGVHDFLAQHSARTRAPHVGRLSRAGRARRHRRRARDHAIGGRQRPRLLRRRHAAGVRACGAGCARDEDRCERHVPDDAAGLRRSRRDRRLHFARFARGARAGADGGPARSWKRTGQRVREPAPERPRVELRRQQLPEGALAARLRPAVLEWRFEQPSRADVRVLPEAPLSEERAARARRADDARRIDRPRAHRASHVRIRVAGRSHRPVARRVRDARDAARRHALRARRVRAHRRRRQSARLGQAQLLDERRARRERGPMACRCAKPFRQLVARLVPVAACAPGR